MGWSLHYKCITLLWFFWNLPLIHNDILFDEVCKQFIAPLHLHNFIAFQIKTTYEEIENWVTFCKFPQSMQCKNCLNWLEIVVSSLIQGEKHGTNVLNKMKEGWHQLGLDFQRDRGNSLYSQSRRCKLPSTTNFGHISHFFLPGHFTKIFHHVFGKCSSRNNKAFI